MAPRSKSSRTISRIKCAGWPAGMKSCTESGSNQISSTRQERKLFVIRLADQMQTKVSNNFTRCRDMLLGVSVLTVIRIDLGLRPTVKPLRSDIAVNKFDDCHRRHVAMSHAGLEDTGVSAVAGLVALGQRGE